MVTGPPQHSCCYITLCNCKYANRKIWNWPQLGLAYLQLESDMKMTRGVALPVAVGMRF